MQFVLKDFKEDKGFRIFVFDGISEDRTRATYCVRADLALAREYGIRLQELPLLCRAVLDRGTEGGRALTYTEDEMRGHRTAARDQAALKRKPPKRPAVEAVTG